MLTKPPLYKNARPFSQFMDGQEFDMLKKHAKIYYGTNSPDIREKRLAKNFSAEKRERLGQIYKKLRENGIYITGITLEGDLEVSYVVVDDPQYQIDAKKEALPVNSERALSWIRKIQERIKNHDHTQFKLAECLGQEEIEYSHNLEELEEAPF